MNSKALTVSNSNTLFLRFDDFDAKLKRPLLKKEPECKTAQTDTLSSLDLVNEDKEGCDGVKERSHSSYLNSCSYKQLNNRLDNVEDRIKALRAKMQSTRHENVQTKQRMSCRLENKSYNGSSSRRSVPVTSRALPKEILREKYYISQMLRAYKDDKSLAKAHLLSSLQILKALQTTLPQAEEEVRRRQVLLPYRQGYENKITVVFDLDETLVHCVQMHEGMTAEHKLNLRMSNGEMACIGLNVRPHARQMLQRLSSLCEIIVFTASHSCYANAVIDFLDPMGEKVHHRLYREHCYVSQKGMHIKDLRVINRELNRVLLVDNAMYSYAWQLPNAIPILPYYYGTADCELKKLQLYLRSLIKESDILYANANTFKLHQYHHFIDNPDLLVEQLYAAARFE